MGIHMEKIRNKMKKILYGGTTDLREQLFRLILFVGMVVTIAAILAGFVLQNALANSLPLCCLLGVILIAAALTFVYHRVDVAAALFAILVICGIFPLMFFASGGAKGGAAVWYVLGILYIFMMFRGKKLLIFLLLAVVSDVSTYVMAYLNPQLVIPLGSELEIYYDSLFAVLTVGLAVGIIMWFHLRLYERERDLTLKQKEEIEQISKSKDAFFTNMSHEIRTPINTIIGLNEMILREDISDEVKEDALHVKNASNMLLTLINDILDFSQIESDRMTIVAVPYSPKELFGDIVDMLQIRMKEKKLDFLIDIDSNLPSMLRGDEVRIKQIMINLLTNAVKYTEKGSVTLSVQGETLEDGRVRMTMSVSDTGIGIKKEDLESLYDYFKRIDQEKNRKIEGSGLGLAITKQLVSLMDGRLMVDSIYTKGSVFTVILDQSVEDAAPVGQVDYAKKLRHRQGGRYQQSFEAPLAKVLLVDDNKTNLMVAEKLLRATKVQINKAQSGEECLELMEKKSYHVVFLDSMMPGMDGQETLKEIRRRESGLNRQTPVIALTADAEAGDEQRYLDAGFDGYLAKPIDVRRMEAEIIRFLPEELLEYRLDPAEEQPKETESARHILQRKRRKIQISTDCGSDLSQKYVERYNLKVMYQYIQTDRGVFRDMKEINVDNLAHYMSRSGNRASVISASAEEYEAFYAEALTETENLIHISMAANTGPAYQNAVRAAQGFGHVHVIDSGHITCGEGLLVLAACRLLDNGCNSVEELCGELNRMKERIETSFLLPVGTGNLKKLTAAVSRQLELYPIIHMKQSGFKLERFGYGKQENVRKRYIRRKLRHSRRIDTGVVFITHAGCSVTQQKAFTEEVLKYIPFEKVIVERASVSCSCSSGIGSIGMAYLTKKSAEE